MTREILERLSGQARRALHAAHRAALDQQVDYVGTEHLLWGLLQDPDAGAMALLRACGVDVLALQQHVREVLQATEGAEAAHLPFTPAVKRALQAAGAEAAALGHAAVGAEHLLLGLCKADEGLAWQLLDQFGVAPGKLREQVQRQAVHDDRDEAVQTVDRPGAPPRRADPTLDDVRTLLETPVTLPLLVRVPAGPEPVGPLVDFHVQQALGCLPQLALGLFLGTVVGAVWGGWKMLLCVALGLGLGLLRSGWLGALGGAFAGYHLAQRLCDDQTEALLLILVSIFAGTCVGDWPRRLRPPRDTEPSADNP
jgi:hypothetical protein